METINKNLMKNKTAMMELIEKLQEIKDLDADVQVLIISGMQEQLLKKEKEKMIDFARLCLNKAKDLDTITSFINAEHYYNQTYLEESKQ
jgi:hypothetical protein